ncbi:argonaute/piwi family protein [Sphingomonas hankookensis]|jgi:hypothetical protein
MSSEVSPHVWYPEPELLFHPERTGDRDIHPLRGLKRFGPYSASQVPSPIRVATIAPAGESTRLFGFMQELHRTFSPRERTDYLPEWPGFSAVFNTRVTAAPAKCRVELEPALDADLASGPAPHTLLADRLIQAVRSLEAFRTEYDVLFVYLPDRWEVAFFGHDDDFDLHDYLKAFAAIRGMPIQIVREGRALSYSCRASVMWRIGLAIYAKAGGIPWKLADTKAETAFIGISYAVRNDDSGSPRFVTCCSQVFDEDGAGLEFIAFDTNEIQVQRENPFLSRAEMFRVITRSLELYRRRHGGRSPRRVMIHKTTEFKDDEVAGCFEALPVCEAVDLIQVVDEVGWRGVWWEQDPNNPRRNEAAAYPVKRGTLLQLGPRDALLWIHGAVDGLGKRPHLQGGRGTPKPIRLVRHAGHGSWDDTAMAALALSKMNWNNDGLYDPLPVTMSYAKVLARVLKRMPRLGSAPFQFRFFM